MKAGKPLACDKGKLFKKRSVDRLVSFFLGAFHRRMNNIPRNKSEKIFGEIDPIHEVKKNGRYEYVQ